MPVTSSKRSSTRLRHQLVVEKFNQLFSVRVDNMAPSYDDVLLRVSAETGYRVKYIEGILREAG